MTIKPEVIVSVLFGTQGYILTVCHYSDGVV